MDLLFTYNQYSPEMELGCDLKGGKGMVNDHTFSFLGGGDACLSKAEPQGKDYDCFNTTILQKFPGDRERKHIGAVVWTDSSGFHTVHENSSDSRPQPCNLQRLHLPAEDTHYEAERSYPFCDLSQFLTHKTHAYNKIVVCH